MKKLKVAMIAPAWLTVPASGYGGTEAMIYNLCRGLLEAGVRVELFTVKGSTAPAMRYHWTYREEQYKHLHKELYDAAAIPAAHVLGAIEAIRRIGNFDVIHDHNTIMGPAILKDAAGLPPVLHTLHQTFSTRERREQGWVDLTPLYNVLGESKRVYFNGISRSQLNGLPSRIGSRMVGVVHHGIDPSEHSFTVQKENYFVYVGRVTAEKGVARAARICAELGTSLKVAGVIGGIRMREDLERAMAAPGEVKDADFVYYRDRVAPYVRAGYCEYVGSVQGQSKDDLIGRAKAFLMPIEWEEPFGVAVIDALVCGTPVVAMRRGSMPEIIEHGVNGFLADSPEEFAQYMRRVDEIDPAACRRSVEERFSYQVMTRQYIRAYRYMVGQHTTQPALLPRRLAPQKGFAFYERLPGIAMKPDPVVLEE